MIDRALEIKTALESLTNSERDLRRLKLEDQEWTLVVILKLGYFKDNEWDSEIKDRLLPMIKGSRITKTLSTNRRPDDSLTSAIYKKPRVTCQLEDHLAMESESGDCDILNFFKSTKKMAGVIKHGV
ncbi:hypothetical protein OUZ56_011637 [Daphnia magna]|uniref:Uncharacterized protein n=1 Tax=Daphnia magna TaxID=35525 RepID=A0ABQ9Z107_9CRUS|nr:hypothetical protein OUZ56_011637 [Daphnia magna]